jgi:hypothetical protein
MQPVVGPVGGGEVGGTVTVGLGLGELLLLGDGLGELVLGDGDADGEPVGLGLGEPLGDGDAVAPGVTRPVIVHVAT